MRKKFIRHNQQHKRKYRNRNEKVQSVKMFQKISTIKIMNNPFM